MRVGVSADGDKNVPCSDFLPARLDLHRIGTGQLGARGDDLGAGIFQTALVKTFQPVDFAVLVGNQRRPVKRAFTDTPAIAMRVLEML